MTYILGKHFWVIFIVLSFFLPKITFAQNPPNLISPPDNGVESKSPKLTWEYSGECVESGSCFLVEVDNSADFSSTEKSSYTNSLSYSPQGLTEGTWNWRVKAKDKAEKWSDWSKVFKFTISSQSASSSPSDTQNSQISPTPAPPETSQKSQSSFTVKDIPPEINSNQEFETLISLILPNNPNQTFYLKGAFKKEGSSNYFGETLSGGDWAKNGSTYSKQSKVSTDKNGNWEGKAKVRPDSEDTGFEGTGSYLFKVARYNDSGSGPTWSNELMLKINAVSTPKPSSSAEVSEEISADEEEGEIDFTASLVKAPERNYEIKIASVAGEATMSNNITLEEQTQVLEDKKVNWLLIILGTGILFGGIGFTYFKIKKERLNAKSLY